VVHFACSFNKIRNRKKEYSIDVGGSRNILEIANNTLSVRQLVYSSSAAVYGGYSNNPEWIVESHQLRPGKYRYGINKTVVEEMFSSTPVRDNLRILNLRICTVVGPSYSSDRNSLNLLVRSPFLPRICADNKIQLLHEEDFISLMSEILHDDKIEGTYNMAPDSFASIRDLAPNKVYLNIPVSLISAVLWILRLLGLFNLQSVSVNIGIFPIVLDPSKLMTRFGYEFKYSTFDAFSKTVLRDQTSRRATN